MWVLRDSVRDPRVLRASHSTAYWWIIIIFLLNCCPLHVSVYVLSMPENTHVFPTRTLLCMIFTAFVPYFTTFQSKIQNIRTLSEKDSENIFPNFTRK